MRQEQNRCKIIDFHTHPFLDITYSICWHNDYCDMSARRTIETMRSLGVTKICGSVVSGELCAKENSWKKIKKWNNHALKVKEFYGDFYEMGFHVHPDFLEESLEEIDRMANLGVRLIGELVPEMTGYSGFASKGMRKIIDYATQKNMIVSLHTTENDDMEKFISWFPDTKIVAAHPGEYERLMEHISRMKRYTNYYLDLSGYGIFRHGALRRIIDEVGVERILFGSDFPSCNVGMYVGGVLFDDLLTDSEKQMILFENATRLLALQ